MVLKRKRKREYYKEFKIVHGVFDEHTMLVLYKLLNKDRISVESLIKEGKESVILSGKTNEGDWVAIKVYRTEADGKEFGPMLIKIVPKNLKEVYKEVLDNFRRLINAGLVHGDLSAYNILFWDKVYFIDFSHGVVIKSPIALDLLKKDVKNVNSYFSKLGIQTDNEKLYKELEQAVKEKVIE